jgi:hypothetical protein
MSSSTLVCDHLGGGCLTAGLVMNRALARRLNFLFHVDVEPLFHGERDDTAVVHH